MTVYLQHLDKLIPVDVTPDSDVAFLEQQFTEATQIGRGRFHLEFQNMRLKSTDLLADASVSMESHINVVLHNIRFERVSANCSVAEEGAVIYVGRKSVPDEDVNDSCGAGTGILPAIMEPKTGRYVLKMRHLESSPSDAGALGVCAVDPSRPEPLPDGMPGLQWGDSWAFCPTHPDRAEFVGEAGNWIGKATMPRFRKGMVMMVELDTDAGTIIYGADGEWYPGTKMDVPSKPLWFCFGDDSGNYVSARLVDE
eukprot:Hpha_TRINITY_DN8293_c0_g1::TRINITY_DN8293_c0_g1_i1::g.111779::m.111779